MAKMRRELLKHTNSRMGKAATETWMLQATWRILNISEDPTLTCYLCKLETLRSRFLWAKQLDRTLTAAWLTIYLPSINDPSTTFILIYLLKISPLPCTFDAFFDKKPKQCNKANICIFRLKVRCMAAEHKIFLRNSNRITRNWPCNLAAPNLHVQTVGGGDDEYV